MKSLFATSTILITAFLAFIVHPCNAADQDIPGHAAAGNSVKHTFSQSTDEFLLDGKPFQIIGGEMHPQRIPHEYWRHRIRMAKAMGLNTIPIYVFWNAIEPEEGKFDFTTGENNIGEFLKIAKEEGMWVILRPGPYCCAEWDLGGLPWWLLKTPDIRLRSSDPRFTTPVARYFHELAKIVRPNLIENGGAILMVQIENEYGSYPRRDHDYMVWLRDLWVKEGVKGPFITADGAGEGYLKGIVIPRVAVGLDTGTNEAEFALARRMNPGVPIMSSEVYPGWLRHWGEGDWHPTDCTGLIKFYMDTHKSFSLYVFHGGTNFGFSAGANGGDTSITSYDYGAPLNEQGCPTPAYFAYRKQLAAYLPAGQTLPEVPATIPTMAIPEIKLERWSGLWEQMPAPVVAEAPECFEELGQNQGFVVYRSRIPAGVKGSLSMPLHGYPQVYVDGVLMKGFEIPARDKAATLEILVQAMGHINFKGEMDGDRKGILGNVNLNGAAIKHWEMFGFPLKSAWAMSLPKTTQAVGRAGGIFKGEFKLDSLADTYLDMSGYAKGVLWINGHNLGIHWSARGPQYRLFCPAPWLKRGTNTIIVLDVDKSEPQPVAGYATARFVPSTDVPANLADAILFEDNFNGPANNPVWTVHVTDKNPQATFSEGGKLGAICAPPDTIAYAEHPWPSGASSAEITVDTGDDVSSNAWGPGLALKTPDGIVAFVVRPNAARFEINGEIKDVVVDRTKPCYLRARLDLKNKLIYCDASQDGQNFRLIGTAPCRQKPEMLRVGKIGQIGGGVDYRDAKGDKLIRCHVTHVVLRGSQEDGKS